MRKFGFERLISMAILNIEPFDRWDIIENLRMKRQGKVTIPDDEILENAPVILIKWPKNIKKPFVGLVRSERGHYAYYLKFERFLKENNIQYEYFDVKKSSFIIKAQKFDVIVWRTLSSYCDKCEATDKIEFMQDFMGKMTLPSKESLWYYEDKVREQWLFDYYHLPAIKTFISYSKAEAEDFIKKAKYPFISKDRTCSSSEGVILVKNIGQAQNICRRIFGSGMDLYEKYIRQKNYVLFQEFVPNRGFDLRVIMVGNSYFGYYRFPRNGDYKASGSGVVEKKEIPLEVLLLAKKVRVCLPKTYLLAVDFLQDSRDNKYYIIESSIFISIETCEQLAINGVVGRYIEDNLEFTFEPGRYWLQDLMMQELMKDWIVFNSEKTKCEEERDDENIIS